MTRTAASAEERGEITELKKAVEKQNLQIERVMDRVDKLEAELAKQEKYTEERAAARPRKTAPQHRLQVRGRISGVLTFSLLKKR